MSNLDLQAWVALANTKGLGPARLQRVASALADQQRGAASLLNASSVDLIALGINSELAEGAAASLARALPPPPIPEDTLLLHPDDERFPLRRLLAGPPYLPALLYVRGESSLLSSTKTVAIVGSRRASESSLQVAEAVARRAVADRWVVASGLARGVDSAAHRGAIDAGGSTIGVLAEGIEEARARGILPNAESILFASQFNPHDAWTPPRAMQRNPTIAALADVVVVVAADTQGGTWEMGKLCLKHNKALRVLDLPESEAPGNRLLLNDGGLPFDGSEPGEALQPEETRSAPTPLRFPV